MYFHSEQFFLLCPVQNSVYHVWYRPARGQTGQTDNSRASRLDRLDRLTEACPRGWTDRVDSPQARDWTYGIS